MSRAAQVASVERQFGPLLFHAEEDLGVEYAALVAVLAVETGGVPGLVDDLPLIRIEAHRVVRKAPGAAAKFKFNAAEPWKDQQVALAGRWSPIHTGKQADEWAAIGAAYGYLDEESTFRCCSMGAAQIMGDNYARVGFESATQMFESFRNLEQQFRAFLRFITTGKYMLPALKKKDWKSFAREYNGPGQVDTYAKWMQEAYDACRK